MCGRCGWAGGCVRVSLAPLAKIGGHCGGHWWALGPTHSPPLPPDRPVARPPPYRPTGMQTHTHTPTHMRTRVCTHTRCTCVYNTLQHLTRVRMLVQHHAHNTDRCMTVQRSTAPHTSLHACKHSASPHVPATTRYSCMYTKPVQHSTCTCAHVSTRTHRHGAPPRSHLCSGHDSARM